ncbi:MAG: tRNA (adenosine(37)-N6)-threonylcarbamoyltransferase complex ATPase subunit type 1 TsaE [Candidatus Poribacteria bacterium]|nr:tRNA (adenosine(37)-N6)-threonylcarbamoyltransferase complex ATPase subunit type 1 TsaE [Candidatus Poribacteria bacterium]
MKETFQTHSPEETQSIGKQIGGNLKAGDVVALIGDLGAGKTCLTQGIACGIGIASHEVVNSPSYTLINEYVGNIPIYHIDLYRLQHHGEIVELGLEEYLEGTGICIIEWADRMANLLPANRIEITMTWVGESTRAIELRRTLA